MTINSGLITDWSTNQINRVLNFQVQSDNETVYWSMPTYTPPSATRIIEIQLQALLKELTR